MFRLLSLLLLALLLLPAVGSPLHAQQGFSRASRYGLPLSLAEARLDVPLAVQGVTAADIGPRLYSQEGPLAVVIRLRTPPVASLAYFAAAERTELVLSIDAEQEAFLERWAESPAPIQVLGRTRLVLNSVLAEVAPELIPRLAQDPAVLTVRPVLDYELALNETVPYIGASSLHNLEVDGTGITVAVIDTGIDYTHANLGGPGNDKSYRAAYGLDPGDRKNTTNDGIFPTAKVIGGFDFLGEFWPQGPLVPDPDPIDFNGHGTHVADIIGGRNGVAPGVEFYALKVCAALGGGCSGVALLQAMEFAVDPNGDGDPSDHVDIVNMSLGAGYGQPFDDNLSAAVDNATRLGVLTLAAAGNGGNRPYITSTPGAAPTAISVAQTQVPSAFIPTISVLEPLAMAGEYRAVFQNWAVPLTEPIEGPVQYADGLGGNLDGCAPFDPDSLEGRIVAVDRGGCFFSDKIRHIQEAGGIMGFIALVGPGQPFAGGFGGGSEITIPAYMVGQGEGDILRQGDARVRVTPGQGIALVGRIVSTSSRGPEYQSNSVKPEIGAPGASLSAEPGTGTGERPFGGTSGATPMVAGAAALLLQGHTADTAGQRELEGLEPAGLRSPLEIKARLMNTGAVDIANTTDGALAPVTRIGGGEVRVNRAYYSPVAAWDDDSPTAALSFGFVEVADPRITLSKRVRLRNYSGQRMTFRVRTSLRYADDRATGAVSLDAPNTVTVEGHSDVVFPVQLTILGERLRGNRMNSGSQGDDPGPLTINEYDGFVTLESTDDSRDDSAGTSIHLPWHVLPRQAARARATGGLAGLGSDPVGIGGDLPRTNALQLSNSGVGAAQNQAFRLLAVSPNLPRGGRGEQTPTPDLRAVGVQVFEVPSGFCSARPSYVLAFGIATWERQTHANWPGIYRVDLDTDRNGVADYMVFNTDAGLLQGVGQGRNMTWVVDLATGGASAFFFTEHATNSANTVLYLCGEQIGSPPARQEIDLSVSALDVYFGGPGDRIDGLTFSPQEDRSLREPLPDVPGGGGDFVAVNGPNIFRGGGEGLGLLIFTNSDRGAFHRGGATADTEALVLLNQPEESSVAGSSRQVARNNGGAGWRRISRE